MSVWLTEGCLLLAGVDLLQLSLQQLFIAGLAGWVQQLHCLGGGGGGGGTERSIAATESWPDMPLSSQSTLIHGS